MNDQERKGNATDDVNFTDYMIEKIAAAIRGGEIMGTVKDENIKNDLEQVASLITAAPEMYELLKEISGVFAANCCIPCHKCHELHGRIDGLFEKARGEEC